MAKGSKFERDICRKLSAWWLEITEDELEDVIFWRTAGSGGRATSRGKKGKKTSLAHCGDLAAIVALGELLTRQIAIEMKRGYRDATLHAALDAPDKAAVQEYAAWVDQARRSAVNARCRHWAIIHRRDRRETVLTANTELFSDLGLAHEPRKLFTRYANALLPVVPLFPGAAKSTWVVSCLLDEFLAAVAPKDIRQMERDG